VQRRENTIEWHSCTLPGANHSSPLLRSPTPRADRQVALHAARKGARRAPNPCLQRQHEEHRRTGKRHQRLRRCPAVSTARRSISTASSPLGRRSRSIIWSVAFSHGRASHRRRATIRARIAHRHSDGDRRRRGQSHPSHEPCRSSLKFAELAARELLRSRRLTHEERVPAAPRGREADLGPGQRPSP
jgi:hypothetical protein